VELIFVSGDKDLEAFKEYHNEMTFPAIPYESRDIETKLSKLFKVEGIPHLEAINTQGEVIHKDEDIDLRSIITQHGAAAFPLSAERIRQLQEEAETKRTETLKSLVDGSIQLNIKTPGSSSDMCSFVELLHKHEYVTLLYGDGDYNDEVYKNVQKVMEETSGEKKTASVIPVYLGWSLYNESCDHTALAKQFHSITDLSKPLREAMVTIAGSNIQAPILGITIRKGTGVCQMNGTCEEAGVPAIVSVDPMLRKLSEFGADASPWDEDSIKEAEKAAEARVVGLKTRIPNFSIFRKEEDTTSSSLLTSSDKHSDVDDLVATMGNDGIVALYFSAHWCPPCQAFTPKLVDCYENLLAAGKKFEVVFFII
jgi:nucleoredoxin